MTVPKRRPPKPHSCSRSKSPLRHFAAAKPSQDTRPNNNTKIVSAIQFTFDTPIPLILFRSVFGGVVDDGSQDRTAEDPSKLKPIKERNPDEGGFGLVVKWRIQRHHELDHEQQVPPAPAAALLIRCIHRFFLRHRQEVDRTRLGPRVSRTRLMAPIRS